MLRRKRKHSAIDNDPLSTKHRTSSALPVKRTFARNKRRKITTKRKHLQQSIVEPISNSDSDFDVETNTKPRNKKRKYTPLKLTKQVKKVQSTLDFPIQKAASNPTHSFNKCGPSKCNDCGMLYYVGRTEDDSLHSKFHKSVMNKFNYGYKPSIMATFIVWNYDQIAENAPYFMQNERKNKRYKQLKITNDCKALEERQIDVKTDQNRKDVVLCIKYDAFMDLKSKHTDILSVVDMMDRDLGYFTSQQLKHVQHTFENDSKSEEIVHSLDQTQSLYCFVERTGHKIVGCVVCEPREFAYTIKIKQDDEDVDMENVERGDVQQKCHLGVVKIWVHYEYRRQHIASVLVDCARQDFMYGTEIDRKHIAFCQPTRMGQHFAQKYCQTKHILVY